MTKLNNLFTAETNTKRVLSGTAEITAAAGKVADACLKVITKDLDTYGEQFEASKLNANNMDALINLITDNLKSIDVDFLGAISDEELNRILRSQQSKRSRLKSKAMTLDNYKAMMNAAICELIIRKYTGKTKTRSGARSEGYTDKRLEELVANQHEIRRELRNVQSKMCIFRKKFPDDYAEHDEYKEYERVEQYLKDHRETIESKPVVTKKKVNDLIGGLNLEGLPADVAEKLAELQELAGGNH